MSATPKIELVLAREVVPYEWGVWCTVGEDPTPCVNRIVCEDWFDDGRISWMLDSFNFYSARPDETVALVRCDLSNYELEQRDRRRKEHEAFLARAPSERTCEACGGTGKVVRAAIWVRQ